MWNPSNAVTDLGLAALNPPQTVRPLRKAIPVSREAELDLIERIRAGDQEAWAECIRQFEGRLMAFVDSRLRSRTAAEDVVQETFLGFLISLPNYDPKTKLETYLFSIAAHKLTDVLRREGRRPTVPLMPTDSAGGRFEPKGRERVASSMMRSHERKGGEEEVIAECLAGLIAQWKANGELERLECVELLFVLGWANKDVAARMGITEQAVANHKHFVVAKLKEAAARARLRDSSLSRYGLD